ncbi:MAG: PKD domain-containing protein [bacterium]|nr:PKD domain-containing protein [bacterium]
MRKMYKRTDSKKLFKTRFFLLLCSLLVFLNAQAFPGGSYTINATIAASSTNYLSFTALANDLKNLTRGDGGAANYAIGGAGVQGPIVVNVNNATYTQQFKLTQIVGVTATNTVTINGNGATIQFTPTITTDAATVDFDGTDFFTIRNLTISSNSTTFGFGLLMRNGADNNVIRKNNFRSPNALTTVQSAYVWMNNGTTASTYGNAGNFNVIDSNDMRSSATTGPYYGIVVTGPTIHAATLSTCGNIISNNNVQDFYLYGLYTWYSNGTIITGNLFHNTSAARFTTKYGIYSYYSSANVENNKVFNLNGITPQASIQYAVYIYNYDNGTLITNQRFRNNIIQAHGTGTLYNYIYFYANVLTGATLDIEYNTLAFTNGSTIASTGTNYTLYGGYWRNVENNIIFNDIAGTGTKYLLYDFGGVTPYSTNYKNNNFDFGAAASGNLIYAYGNSPVGTHNTFANMQTAGLNASNVSIEPEFVNPTPSVSDFTPTSLAMANKGKIITGASIDYSRAARSLTPDIGALEYSVDIAVTNFNLVFPSPTCAGYTTAFGGTIKNNSAITVKNPAIAYRVNNNAKVVYNVPGTMAPGGTLTFNFPGTYKFSVSGPTKVSMFVSTPDDNVSNDSASTSTFVTVPPGGSVLTQNGSLSSTYAKFDITGKPDITFESEKMVYDMTAPSRVGYNNSQYLSKWIGQASAKTINGFNANSVLSTSVTAPFNVTINAPKKWEDSTIVVTIQLVDFATGCDTSYIRRIFIAPKPVVNVKIATTLCEKSDIYFDNATTISSGSVEYEWNFGDGTGTFTEASPNHNFASSGGYVVTLKATSKPYNFVASKTYNINVTQVPEAKIINVNTCKGVPVTLGNGTVYGGIGTTTYTWDYGDGSALNVTNLPNPIYKNYAVAGPYTVKLSAAANGCVSSVTKNVYQFANPVASFIKTAGSCLNSEFAFTNTSTISLGRFGNTWDFKDAGNRSSESDPTYTFRTAGTKNVKLLVISEFGCADSISINQLVLQTPTTDFTYPYACSKTATPFNNTTNLNGEILQDYLWSFGDGTNSSTTNASKVWNSVGTKMVTLRTNLANTCSSEVTKTLEVGVKPSVYFEAEDRCSDSDVPFTNYTTFENGVIDYLWSFGDGITSKLAAPIHNYGSGVTQTYTVQLKASIQGGCKDSLSKTITVQPLPSTCDFDIIRNSASGLTNYSYVPKGGSLTGISYKWLTGDGNRVLSAQAGASYTYTGTNKYCVTMVAKNAADCECSKTKCFQLSTGIISAESMNNAVTVFPNPNNGLFNIALASDNNAEMTINVYNTLGELVKTVVTMDHTVSMDLSSYAAGVYVIKVISGNQIATQKINVTK